MNGVQLAVLVGALSIGLLVTIIISIFGHVQGGGHTASEWFSWHPVLMTLAFGVLMPLGRFPYIANARARRAAHIVMMSLALLAMLGGYLCIFMAHWPKRKFFGYHFREGEFGGWAGVVHCWIGYLVTFLTLIQASAGGAKVHFLSKGLRRFLFHGQLGKAIMCFAVLAVLFAAVDAKWIFWRKDVVVVLFAAVVIASLCHTPPQHQNSQDASKDESNADAGGIEEDGLAA